MKADLEGNLGLIMMRKLVSGKGIRRESYWMSLDLDKMVGDGGQSRTLQGATNSECQPKRQDQ